jgi:predicted PP-loop superfamily ATPase
MSKNPQTCSCCVLHTDVPGVTVDGSGICSVCRNYRKFEAHEPRARQYLLEEMETLFKKIKIKKRPYHVIVLFSGGKDSTILLKMAREKYHLRPLAFSIVHPLVNETASKNMEAVARQLNVDLVKVYLDEEVYKKAVRQGILKGPDYGLGEFFGCDICSFFHFWIPIKYAMKMDIPVVLEGSDLSQTGEITYWQAERVKADIRQGKKPFGRVHDLVMDVLGEEYRGSIYDYDEVEVLNGMYPTVISPFTFLDYDYRENFSQIEKMGLSARDFRTIYTNCSATPFFSYFSLKRFDCVSYIRHYATEVRRGYPNLMQHSVKDKDTAEVLNRETVETLMAEYKNVVLYIGQNKLTEASIGGEEKEKLKGMAPTYLDIFGEDVCDVFLHDVLQIPRFADYFDVDLDHIGGE